MRPSRPWGVVLMAAAGSSAGAGAPTGTVARWPVGGRRQNQTITFALRQYRRGETIRATARGPVDGFARVRMVDFHPDAAAGRFHGVWELVLPRGTVRYSFSGAARGASRPSGAGRSVPALPAGASSAGGVAVPEHVGLVTAEPRHIARYAPGVPGGRALVAGEFTLSGGTGRYAGLSGRGAFRGWTMPAGADALPADDVD